MLEEMLDHLVSEKIDYREYKQIADKMEDMRIKEMFNKISEDEHNHYKMLKEYISQNMD